MENEGKRSRTVTWADPFELLKAGAGRTGLELLRDYSEGRLPPPPIAITLGFNLVDVEEGRAVFEGESAEYLFSPIGFVHGGYAMTLLDSAMGCAIHSTLKAGDRYTTLEMKTNFVRPITLETGRVRCEGVVIHRGNTIATAEGKVTDVNNGKLLAHGTTTCLIIPAR
ncbi:MAG TPA: PaaI family thioesterase [Candidatus Limnocylindrales bacterium]|nr:PaaI family thioesterase [Candidatus Limnocylindrales bacterium]